MSQNSDEEYSAAEPRRGSRKKKLSQRAADAIQAEGEVIPGISPKRPLSPDNPLNGHTHFLSTPEAQSPARGPVMANQSKVAKPAQATAKARPVDAISTAYELEELEPSEEERSNGIAKWTRNREGVAEPWYEGETPNPSGIQNGIQDYLEQRGQSDDTLQQERRGGAPVPSIGNIGTTGPIGLSAVSEVVASALGFSKSDEGA